MLYHKFLTGGTYNFLLLESRHPNTNLNRSPRPISYVTINKDVKYDLLRTRNTIKSICYAIIHYIHYTYNFRFSGSKQEKGWDLGDREG